MGLLAVAFLCGSVGLVLPPPSQADVQFGGIKKVLKKIYPPCGPGTKQGRFVPKGDKVCDNKTGLWWQRTPGEPPDANCGNNDICTWQEAIDYCANLELTGKHTKKKQWRLAEVKEYISLLDYSVPVQAANLNEPNGKFIDVKPAFYWSASEVAGDPADAWDVNFIDGFVVTDVKGNDRLAWCVRGDGDVH